MTIPRVQAITNYQKKCPPIHLMIAAYMGVGEKKEPGEKDAQAGLDENGMSLFDMFPQKA